MFGPLYSDKMESPPRSLKSSLLNFGQERDTNRKSISSLNKKIFHLKNLQSSHQDEAATLEQKLSNIHAHEVNLTADSRTTMIRGLFLKVGILTTHHDKHKIAVKGIGKLIDGTSSRKAANQQKWLVLEKANLSAGFKSKIQCIREKLSELYPLRQSCKEFSINKETEFSSKYYEIERQCGIESQKIYDDYCRDLNQDIQNYRSFENDLKEQISVNGKVNEELESCAPQNEFFDKHFQETLNALNSLKKSSDEHLNELEFSLNRVSGELDTVGTTANNTEETLEAFRKEEVPETEVENSLLAEESDLKESILEDETNTLNLQQRKLVAENFKFDLLKTKTDLEQEASSFLEEKCCLQNEFDSLKGENSSLSEKIQEEIGLHKKTLSDAEIALQDETSKIANLESDFSTASEISLKSKEELQEKASIATENALKKEKHCTLKSQEEVCVRNKESLMRNSKALNNELTAVIKNQTCEIEKLSALFLKEDLEIESAENQLFQLSRNIEESSHSVIELRQEDANEWLKLEDFSTMTISITDEKTEALEIASAEIKTKLSEAQKNFAVLYKSFNQKYREKGALSRTLKVNYENLSEKLEKAREMDSKLQEMLTKNLQVGRRVPQKSTLRSPSLSPAKKVQFSCNLEKFSPVMTSQTLLDAVEKPMKSILKRKMPSFDESPKKLKEDKENIYCSQDFD